MTEIDSDRWTKIAAKKKEINNLVLDEYDYSSKFKELSDVSPTSRLEVHKKEKNRNQNRSSTQTFNQNSSIISTNKSWK